MRRVVRPAFITDIPEGSAISPGGTRNAAATESASRPGFGVPCNGALIKIESFSGISFLTRISRSPIRMLRIGSRMRVRSFLIRSYITAMCTMAAECHFAFR